MAAPALAASIADCAICAGVTGTAGLRPGVSAEPVTAHETMTLRCMPLSQDTDRALQRSLARGRCRAQSFAWAEWIKPTGAVHARSRQFNGQIRTARTRTAARATL